MEMGVALAAIGAALAVGLAGAGSSIGLALAGKASAGVVGEKPSLFGKIFVLQALPATQGIYGFLVAILIITNVGFLTGNVVALDVAQGWSYFAVGISIGISGLVSGAYQGYMTAAAIKMTGKDPSLSARGMTMVVMIETYAILGLLISILMLFQI
ncbi:MAG: V-type ATP synthase subunit K [Bacilli bacterium]